MDEVRWGPAWVIIQTLAQQVGDCLEKQVHRVTLTPTQGGPASSWSPLGQPWGHVAVRSQAQD